jgi:hypothetical protein
MSVTRNGRSFQTVPSGVLAKSMPPPGARLVKRPASPRPEDVEDPSVLLKALMGDMSGALIIDVPERMQIRLTGINGRPAPAIALAHDPCSVMCYRSEKVKILCSSSLLQLHPIRWGACSKAARTIPRW